jgi:hypothetical protein
MPVVRIDSRFKKRLEKKTVTQQAAILECIERLADDPRYPGLQTHPIQTQPGTLSARVDRANRVSFERDGDTLVMLNHCNHDEVYRRR